MKRLTLGVALAILGLATTGCTLIPQAAPDPTRFYVLSPASPASASGPAADGGLVIGVRSIDLAGYLRSRSMVVRDGRNEIAFQDYSRWAEPLDQAIGRAVRTQLIGTAGVSRVVATPFPFDLARTFDVSVQILRFEGVRADDNNYAQVEATIEVTGPDGTVLTRRAFSSARRPWDGRDYGALAAALSEATAELTSAIAAAVPPAAP